MKQRLLKKRLLVATAICGIYFSLSGCEHFRFEPKPSAGHVTPSPADSAHIPEPVNLPPPLPTPQPPKKEQLHTVVVSDVPVRELLFSMARDADLNLDIDNDVDGTVTINAINQPLAAIVERIAINSNLRYEINNNVLRVRKDLPFLRNYRVDYLNMSRTSDGDVNVSTQINATGQGAGDNKGGGGGGGDNNSSTKVKNVSENAFWATLQKNIAGIISGNSETPAADTNNPNIMLNRESGIVGVRATEKQHQEIQLFIDEVQHSAERQVLIEATIAEVKLSDRYQAGINWSLVRDATGGHNVVFDISNTINDIALDTLPTFNTTASTRVNGNLLQTTLQALQTFGDVKVMSSPKVMAINNQTAILKVVDNLVYFTVDVNVEAATATTGRVATYETKINTVPVGFVMSVTPYINEHGSVTLNVRPTISRVIDQKRDPNPALASLNVISEIPVIQVREVESVLKVNSGDIAVIGGLMQDEISKNKRGIPVLSKLPVVGALFRYDDDDTAKTELVIFIKPTVVKHASINGDLSQFKEYLPDTSKNANTHSTDKKE